MEFKVVAPGEGPLGLTLTSTGAAGTSPPSNEKEPADNNANATTTRSTRSKANANANAKKKSSASTLLSASGASATATAATPTATPTPDVAPASGAGAVVVTDVKPTSPLRAQIRVGDSLLKIDGLDVSRLSVKEVVAILALPANRRFLVLHRPSSAKLAVQLATTSSTRPTAGGSPAASAAAAKGSSKARPNSAAKKRAGRPRAPPTSPPPSKRPRLEATTVTAAMVRTAPVVLTPAGLPLGSPAPRHRPRPLLPRAAAAAAAAAEDEDEDVTEAEAARRARARAYALNLNGDGKGGGKNGKGKYTRVYKSKAGPADTGVAAAAASAAAASTSTSTSAPAQKPAPAPAPVAASAAAGIGAPTRIPVRAPVVPTEEQRKAAARAYAMATSTRPAPNFAGTANESRANNSIDDDGDGNDDDDDEEAVARRTVAAAEAAMASKSAGSGGDASGSTAANANGNANPSEQDKRDKATTDARLSSEFHNPTRLPPLPPPPRQYEQHEVEESESRMTVAVEAQEEAQADLREAKRLYEEAITKKALADDAVRDASETEWEVMLSQGTFWTKMYGKLRNFREENGHCRVNRNWHSGINREDDDNRKLGVWVGKQRRLRRQRQEREESESLLSEESTKPPPKERLEPWQELALNKLGIDWDPIETAWQSKLRLVEEFKAKNGHCNVSDSEDVTLYKWIREQRHQYRIFNGDAKPHRKGRNPMTKERIDRLRAIKFEWDVYETEFDANFICLLAFKTVHGHCHVPQNYDANPGLWKWAKELRANYRKYEEGGKNHMNPLTNERVQKLEDAGFAWDLHEARWDLKLRDFALYLSSRGSPEAERIYHEKHLAVWEQTQRNQHKALVEGRRTSMTEERARVLHRLGFFFGRTPYQPPAPPVPAPPAASATNSSSLPDPRNEQLI